MTLIPDPIRCRRQRGAAALFLSVILLFLSTLVLIAVSRTSILEQRISGNEIRYRQALEAAQAGVDEAIAYISNAAAGGLDRDNNDIADRTAAPYNGPTTLASGASYAVAVCNPGTVLNDCPDSPAALTCGAADTVAAGATMHIPIIQSCGWSDDKTARQTIILSSAEANSLAAVPSNPLIAKGGIDVTGSASITNYYNNLTIWSGDSLSNIGNAGKTFVRDPTLAPPSTATAPPSPPSTCSGDGTYICLTNKNTTGPDIIQNDLTLSNLTDAQMFENFFGSDFATYSSTVASQVIDAATESAKVNSLDDNGGVRGQTIVISGDVSLPNGTIGSRDRPVIIIIDGDWLGGNVTVHGIVYVRGNVDLAGNPLVYGTAVVEGDVGGTGSLDVVYDPLALGNAKNIGKPGVVPGSWRDWL